METYNNPTTQILDLNVDKILESWTIAQAVRELIANALDEQTLSQSDPVQISDLGEKWEIRDFGRGIHPNHFVLNENPEKLNNPKIIGKFGFGLKDALGTLFRNGVEVEIHSRHGYFTLIRQQKSGLEEMATLHVIVSPPTDPRMVGTSILLHGVTAKDMSQAKNMFLQLADPPIEVLDTLPIGQIIRYTGKLAPIFVNGLQVGEEPRFLFGYNIIAPTPALQRAMNRERRHVGRTAYVSQVKELLLKSEKQAVIQVLAEDFARKPPHEELTWLPVQEHAVRLLNKGKKYVFYKDDGPLLQNSLISEVQRDGLIPLGIPKKLWKKILGQGDYQQSPIFTLDEYAKQRNANFQPEFISEEELTEAEQQVWASRKKIFGAIGGRPAQIREVRVAEKIVLKEKANSEVIGVWEEKYLRIVVRRDQLRSHRAFAAVLLHEIAHATSGADDITAGFEHELTNLLGKVAEALLNQ